MVGKCRWSAGSSARPEQPSRGNLAVSMEMTAWTSMYHAMHKQDEKRPFSKATLKRILAFARPHKRALIAFLLLSIGAAVLAVATPVLAGQVVDAIVGGKPFSLVLRLAVLIAVIAVAEAGL